MDIGTKQCGRCSRMLPVSEFNRDKHTKSGLRSQCKGCMKQERARLREHYREWRQDPAVKERYRRYRRGHYSPMKMAARNATRTLVRQPCEECGSKGRIHGHHDDYAKPLKIRWLCAACHRQWHMKHGEAKNAR